MTKELPNTLPTLWSQGNAIKTFRENQCKFSKELCPPRRFRIIFVDTENTQSEGWEHCRDSFGRQRGRHFLHHKVKSDFH